MKITIIGAGNMGCAIAKGLCKGSIFKPSDITCTDKSESTLKNARSGGLNVNLTQNNIEAVKGADIVLFAVKPWVLPSAANEVKSSLDYDGQIIISIAAGVGLEKLSEIFRHEDGSLPGMFYLIPNIAVEVKEGVFLYASKNASKQVIDLVQRVFGELGFAKHVEEKQMTACTALSSCGIAYAFRFIRANIEGAVEMGLSPQDAQDITLHTIKGAVELLLNHKTHPEVEIDKVTTPGGLTIKGLNAMEEAGFTSAVIKGLKAGK